ncbi:MAG: GNAT family N-acetyltransferase [Vicinamibacterales bacterium]
MTAPTLDTVRASLRPFSATDLDAAHTLWTDPDVRRYLWDDQVISRQRAAEALAESDASFRARGYGLWAVMDRERGDLAGFCGARCAEGEVPELIYGLRPAWWGRGLATECAAAVLDHLFGAPGRAEVVALTDAPNARSVRVLERLGMTFERRAEHHGLDTVFYRLRAADWRARRVVVRRAVPADEPVLRSLTPRLADFPRPAWRTAHEIDVSDHRHLFDALHHARPDALVLVAETVAGHGMAFVTTPVDYFTQQPHPHLETLAVAAAAEGRGVGRALLDAAEGWARQRGHDFITLTVFEGNRRARRVYERRGYLAETITMRKPLEAAVGAAAGGRAEVAGLVIRPDVPADADAEWAIMQPVIAAGETYAWPRDWSREAALAAWHPPGGRTFVAELDGGIAGTYFLKPNQGGPGAHVVNCGYMVAAAARGRGLAEAMCRHSIETARALGFRAMQFNSVVSTNHAAIRVWQRCGFAVVGTVPQAFEHPVHGLVDIHVMHRFL